MSRVPEPDPSAESRRIELLYFQGCPNHEAFLPHLRRLLHEHGVRDAVRLIEISGEEEARTQRFLGSPSLRIDDHDVDPDARGRSDYGMQCRLYLTENGVRGTPPDSWILRAITGEAPGPRGGAEST